MYSKISSIAEAVSTPFYIAYPDIFRENVRKFSKAFADIYKKFIFSYSFKTNYTPFLLKIIQEENLFAETVSEIEYNLATQLDFPGNHIILNGPVKTEALLEKAIANGSIINLDSLYEVQSVISIKKKFPNKDIHIGLRINMEITKADGSSAIQAGLAESRFGFSDEILREVIPCLKANGIKINSLHGHVSSTNHSVENFKTIAERLVSIGKTYELDDIEYVDLGGSFFGAAPKEVDTSKRPSYSDYAQAICDILLQSDWFQRNNPYIVIEPGASVVTNVFELVTKIYQRKKIRERNFVFTDASVYQVRPKSSKTNYPYIEISNHDAEEEIIADIVGSTCMETDIIANQVKLKHYSHGDFLIFKGSGAYRQNLTPFFINPRCAIIALTADSYKVIRKRQDAKHLLDMLM